ncbi:hypothetical protein [Sphingobium yanoikuyae]|uniref:hypothetical protein n=1 Tax=Sphingobium yanoikuyae TaxID=13690 RepID=UPI003F0E432F
MNKLLATGWFWLLGALLLVLLGDQQDRLTSMFLLVISQLFFAAYEVVKAIREKRP